MVVGAVEHNQPESIFTIIATKSTIITPIHVTRKSQIRGLPVPYHLAKGFYT